MKKRVALCFSGQFRNVETGFSYINENIIKPNLDNWEFKTFVHSWFDQEDVGKQLLTAKGLATGNGETGCNDVSNDVLSLVYRLYNPDKMLVEKQIDFDEKDYATRKSAFIIPKFSLSKMYSTYKVCGLKRDYEVENNMLFNLVISLRFDLGIQNKVNLNDFSTSSYSCSEYGVYMNVGVDISHAIMGSQIFDQYATLIKEVDNIWRVHGLEFADERMTHKHLDLLNININRTNKLNSYFLIRS